MARTSGQRSLGWNGGQLCSFVPSPLPPDHSPPPPLPCPSVRLLEQEDKEMKEKWHFTTWEDPKWAARKVWERIYALSVASTPPPVPPDHRGVAWVLAGVSFLMQVWKKDGSVQTLQMWYSPALLFPYVPREVTGWCLQSSIPQLCVCESTVDGDICEIMYGEDNDHSGSEKERGRFREPEIEIILWYLGHKMELSDISSEFLCIGFAWFGPSLWWGLPKFSLCPLPQLICSLVNIVWKGSIT